MKRNYFIKYNPQARINYLYIFMLYGVSQYSAERRKYDTIYYRSIKDLANTIKEKYEDNALSYSTLTRIIKDVSYSDYFHIDDHFVILHNDFNKYGKQASTPFIIIDSQEADKLIEQGDSLLASYYCYLKYYCGLASKIGRVQDFTARQFLSTVGLSSDNHNNLSRVSQYNRILTELGMIKIDKYRDINGYERNIYSILSI